MSWSNINSTVKYSFVIPVRNGESTIALTLRSIQAQAQENFEIIVVDNQSIDETKKVIEAEEFQLGLKPRVNYYYCEKIGRSSARNFGAQKAIGNYIVFVDADVILGDGWLLAVDSYLNQMPCDAISTKIIPQVEKKCVVDMYRSIRKEWSSSVSTPYPIINTAACVYTRHLFLASGGFDETLLRNEDAELSIRLFLAGHIIGSTSKALSLVRFYPEIKSSARRGLTYLVRSSSVGFHSFAPPIINRSLLAFIWNSDHGIILFLYALLVELAFCFGGFCTKLLKIKRDMNWKFLYGKKTILFSFKHEKDSYYILKPYSFLFSDKEAYMYQGLSMIKALDPIESCSIGLMLNGKPIDEKMAQALVKLDAFAIARSN